MNELNLTTPSLLFSAISLILLAYTNRFLSYASVVRTLNERYQENPDKDPTTLNQIRNFVLRLRLIRAMQTFGAVSLILCLVSMFLFTIHQPLFGEIVFGAGMTSLAISLVLCIWEIQISTEAISLHLQNIRRRQREQDPFLGSSLRRNASRREGESLGEHNNRKNREKQQREKQEREANKAKEREQNKGKDTNNERPKRERPERKSKQEQAEEVNISESNTSQREEKQEQNRGRQNNRQEQNSSRGERRDKRNEQATEELEQVKVERQTPKALPEGRGEAKPEVRPYKRPEIKQERNNLPNRRVESEPSKLEEKSEPKRPLEARQDTTKVEPVNQETNKSEELRHEPKPLKAAKPSEELRNEVKLLETKTEGATPGQSTMLTEQHEGQATMVSPRRERKIFANRKAKVEQTEAEPAEKPLSRYQQRRERKVESN